MNGRGLAAADVDNNGRMAVAVNTIGGKLLLLEPKGTVGNWLDVKLSRFVPGAEVTATVAGASAVTEEVRAGSSFLSSEDPRVHFGLGTATTVPLLTVRYPWGATSVLHNVAANRIVDVAVPTQPVPTAVATTSPLVPACTATAPAGSIATAWLKTAVEALRVGQASEPVQARDLYDVSTAMWNARHSSDPSASISYAAYRVLLWDASFNANLSRSFGILTSRLKSLCYSPAYATTSGTSPAALGNRTAAAVIAAGRHDGSNEALHFADPSFVSTNSPLIVHASGSTVEDATFWQPLALATKESHGLTAVPADVQQFVGSQWGHVRSFALPASSRGLPIGSGATPEDPSSAAYRQAAIAVLRATSASGTVSRGWSPLDWAALAARIAPRGLAADLRLYLGVTPR